MVAWGSNQANWAPAAPVPAAVIAPVLLPAPPGPAIDPMVSAPVAVADLS